MENKQFESPSSSNYTGGVDAYAHAELSLASQTPKKRAGRKIFKETRHPVYRGVRSRNTGKWVCEVREPINQKRVWLGSYPTAVMAARAHDVAVLAFRGRSACLNFADSVWRLPVPESSNIIDIQKAAAQAAEAFRHTEDVVAESIEVPRMELVDETIEDVVTYVDDEELFEMPGLIASMAEGLMLPPPQMMGYSKAQSRRQILRCLKGFCF